MVTTSEKCGKGEWPLKGNELISKCQLNLDNSEKSPTRTWKNTRIAYMGRWRSIQASDSSDYLGGEQPQTFSLLVGFLSRSARGPVA